MASPPLRKISEGISQTEATIRELQTITGVQDADQTPSILDTDLSPQRTVQTR